MLMPRGPQHLESSSTSPHKQQQNFWSAQVHLHRETEACKQKAEAQPGCASFLVNAGRNNPRSVMHFI